MKNFLKQLSLWVVIFLVVALLWRFYNAAPPPIAEMVYSDFLAKVDQGQVLDVTIKGRDISGTALSSGKGGKEAFVSYAPDDPELLKSLRQKGVRIVARPEDETPWYVTALVSWLPMVLLIGVWIFFMRQMQAGGSKALSFGKSRARLLSDKSGKATFQDVAGVDEAKEELKEIIDFLRDPRKFQKLGGKIPKGVLLMGPPGTGKTLLARAVAGEADVPFFSISGSDFVEMFVGVGASRVRDLFEQGKKHAPCIIFIDEIDAVGRQRGAGLGGGHDEREQTLNQLLVEMDGFESNEGLILVAATNRPDVLDPALIRPGRFDRQVVVPLPDVRGRAGILKVHAAKIPMAPDVDLEVVARGTPGFSGADLANLVNEAALLAARRDRETVGMAEFEESKDKVMMGAERKSIVINDEEKRITAYHEAGHTLVARKIPGTDPIHKVTIIPRGRAMGLTQSLPIDERHNYSTDYLVSRLAILMGGRAAEELVLKETTTGAVNDIEKATGIARRMVCEWGMSDALGPLAYGKKEEMVFLGREISSQKDYSETTSVLIDKEVHRLVTGAHERARSILSDHLDALNRLALVLLEREVLDGHEVDRVIAGETLPPLPIVPPPATPGAAPDAPPAPAA